MQIAALLMAAAVTAAPAPEPPTDPAVTVCEMMIRAGLRAPESYRRLAAPLFSGASVTLTFEAYDARRRPKRQEKSCDFSREPDGTFRIEPFRKSHLASRLAEARAKLSTATDGQAALLAKSEIIDIGREQYVTGQQRREAEYEAARSGDYPLKPGTTRLK